MKAGNKVPMGAGEIARVVYGAMQAHDECYGFLPGPGWEVVGHATRRDVIGKVEHLMARPKATFKQIHNEWVAKKKKERMELPKEERGRSTPMEVPFESLPPRVRSRCDLMLAIVRTLA